MRMKKIKLDESLRKGLTVPDTFFNSNKKENLKNPRKKFLIHFT